MPMRLKHSLYSTLAEALSEAAGISCAEIFALLEKPKKSGFGDVAFPCFALAKIWKLAPAACAAKLKEALQLPQGVAEVQAMGPFLNFYFERKSFIAEVLQDAAKLETPRQLDKTVVVEYSSPNIAKPFHVGHLRATLIGNCLDRVYRFLGWKTISINHLGDWGTQFGFVWAGCKLWGFPQEPSVAALVELYRRATALKSEQEAVPAAPGEADVNEMARSYFIDLEKGEEYAVKFWQQCVDISLAYLKKTYQI